MCVNKVVRGIREWSEDVCTQNSGQAAISTNITRPPSPAPQPDPVPTCYLFQVILRKNELIYQLIANPTLT